MGNKNYEIPVEKVEKTQIPLIKKNTNIVVPNLDNKKGIIIISDNTFLKRLWFFISNPFRYIFTGKIRY